MPTSTVCSSTCFQNSSLRLMAPSGMIELVDVELHDASAAPGRRRAFVGELVGEDGISACAASDGLRERLTVRCVAQRLVRSLVFANSRASSKRRTRDTTSSSSTGCIHGVASQFGEHGHEHVEALVPAACRSMLIGGARRITVLGREVDDEPRSSAFSTSFSGGCFSSMPRNSPRPRTAATLSAIRFSFFSRGDGVLAEDGGVGHAGRPARSRRRSSARRPCRSRCRRAWSRACRGRAAAAISGLAYMTPTGSPPPTALPRVMMSGVTGLPSAPVKCWWPNHRPGAAAAGPDFVEDQRHARARRRVRGPWRRSPRGRG